MKNHRMMRNLKEMIMSEMARELVQQALDQDYNKANKTFGDMMGTKISAALDQEQIRLADQIYNGVEPDEDEDDIMGDEDDIDETESDFETEDEFESDDEDDEEEFESDEDEEDFVDEDDES